MPIESLILLCCREAAFIDISPIIITSSEPYWIHFHLHRQAFQDILHTRGITPSLKMR